MIEKNKLTIVIVTYNSDAIINNCLTSISLEKNEVFVVDRFNICKEYADYLVDIHKSDYPNVKIVPIYSER